MSGIDGDRRQHRKDMIEEVILEPDALVVGELIGVKHVDAGVGKERDERHPAFLLLGCQLHDRAVDAVELLGGRQAVLARRLDAADHLAAQTRHAHHVKFVQIVGRYREEAQTLKQRMSLVLGLLEHPPVEVEPGQLAVEKTARPHGGNAGTKRNPLDLLWQTHRVTS